MSPLMYNFRLDIADTDQDRAHQVRVQTARHYDESIERLHARVLAFALSFTGEEEFTQGLWEPEQPAIWASDPTGAVTQWIEVGLIESAKLKRALQKHPEIQPIVYFFESYQVDRFVASLRGNGNGVIASGQFFQISTDFLATSSTLEKRSSQWIVTLSGERVYVDIDGTHVETAIEPVDLLGTQANVVNC